MKKNKVGRPTEYTEELADLICEYVMLNSKGLPTLCQENPDFPSHETIYRWISTKEEFCDKYARAKKAQVNILVDNMYDLIAQAQTREEIYKARLFIDTVKWQACKLVPKVWGDKVDHTGSVEIKHAEALDQLK